ASAGSLEPTQRGSRPSQTLHLTAAAPGGSNVQAPRAAAAGEPGRSAASTCAGGVTMFELDHLFLWGSLGGLEADRLRAFGLTEGEPNTHPGQGTACRRFFFRNAYLEVVWVHDPVEAQGEAARPTGLWPRWCGRATGTSPFGLCLRPVRPGGG